MLQSKISRRSLLGASATAIAPLLAPRASASAPVPAALPVPAAAQTAPPVFDPGPLSWLYPPLGQKQVTEADWAPVQGNTLRITLDGNVDALDPHRSTSNWTLQVTHHICESLVSRGPDLSFQPWLATSWEMAPSGTEWTFHLRQDVTFHDGTPLNAEAVKFSFDRVQDPATKAGQAFGLVSSLATTEVVDDFTIRFTLKQPAATFLLNLSHPSLAIVSPTAVQELGEDFGRQPVGTGPWKFKEWQENIAITLSRYDEYRWPPPFYRHEDAAFPEEMVFGLVYEPTTRLASLKAGESHYMSVTPFVLIEELREDPRMRLWGVILPGVANIITLNTQKAPLDDVRVRRALLHGFDRQTYVEVVTQGLRPVHDSVLSPATWGYNPDVAGMYPYDVAKAAALLDEAGWLLGDDSYRHKDDQTFHIVWNGNSQTAGEVLQAQFQPLGVEVEVLVTETGTWLADMHAGKYHASTMAWGYLDPSVLRNIYHSSNIGKTTFQWSRYSNPTVDQLLDSGETELDPEKRLALYYQVQQIVMEDAVAIPTSVSTAVTTHNTEILGGEMWQDGSQMEWLYDTYVKQ